MSHLITWSFYLLRPAVLITITLLFTIQSPHLHVLVAVKFSGGEIQGL